MNPAREKSLDVLIAGTFAGRLIMSGDGELTFSYHPAYQGPDLSVGIPVSSDDYVGRRVLAWFDNLLPDNPQVRRGMAAEAGTSTGVFPLLARFGLDLPGAIQVVAPDETHPSEREGGYVLLTDRAIGARLRRLADDDARHRARSWTTRDEHWSLGGMQAKLALRRHEGRWYECTGSGASNTIVKPGAAGLDNQALVEYATMRLAAACGLPTASVSLENFDGAEAIAIERYDRFTSPESGQVTRIHQEDLCQALATPSSKKYTTDGGPSSVQARELMRGAEGNSTGRFVDALLFNCLTASTDAHAKNYSLLHPAQGRYLLAPLYDVASAAPFMKKGKTYHLAMSIGGENRVGWLRKSSLERFAKIHGLDAGALIDRTDEIADAVVANIDAVLGELPHRDGIDRLTEVLRLRLLALCRATQRNIRVESTHFEAIDITRYNS